MTRDPPTIGALFVLLATLAAGTAAAAGVRVRVTDAAGQPLPEAAVFLESREAQAATRPEREASIAQVDKQFRPRVKVVTVGTAVAFPNLDKVRHHVYSFSPAKTFELKLYAGTPANPVVFDKAGIATLGCNIHDQMSAWVVVVETPHHGLTGADGRVAIDNVPRGGYQLRAWHASQPPGAAALQQPLQVEADGAEIAVQLKDARR